MGSPSVGTIVLSILCVLLGVFLTVLYQRRGTSDETRQKRIRTKLQNTCPHIHLSFGQDKTVFFKPLFVSPPGTVNWICGQCQLMTTKEMSDLLINGLTVDYVLEKQKQFNRLMKKHGYA